MALRRVHKLYLDSRAAQERSHGHGDFVWAPVQSIVVDKCRAFIDSVHIPQSFGSIGTHNANTYVAEEQADFTVLSGQNKVYIQETVAGVTTERIVQIAVGVYATEAALASALQSALGGSYAVSGGSGTLTISHPSGFWNIPSRKTLQQLTTFAGTPVIKSALQDASELLGTVDQAVYHLTGTLTLGTSKVYRKVTLTPGHRSADDLKTALESVLTTGSTIGAYTVTFSPESGKLTVSAGGTFSIYSGHYLRSNPYEFPGFSAPWAAGDDATGLAFTTPSAVQSITGNQFVNILPHHTLMINSDLGSHNDSIGPVGQSSIARKVVCDVPHGSMIHDYHSQALDYITLEKQSITAIRVRLTDWEGTPIEVESHWSLSIIIIPESEF